MCTWQSYAIAHAHILLLHNSVTLVIALSNTDKAPGLQFLYSNSTQLVETIIIMCNEISLPQYAIMCKDITCSRLSILYVRQ